MSLDMSDDNDFTDQTASRLGPDDAASQARTGGFWRRVWDLYADGFRNMTIGRYLWVIIIFKLIVIFLVLKLFFFPDLLSTNYDNDQDRAEAVRSALTNPKE